MTRNEHSEKNPSRRICGRDFRGYRCNSMHDLVRIMMNRSPRGLIVYGTSFGATKGTSEEIARILRGKLRLDHYGESRTRETNKPLARKRQ